MPERLYFGKIKEASEPPNLIEVQLNSYVDFLQKDISASKRKNSGLQAVFKEVFPIESYDDKATLDFSHYEIGEPKLSALDAQREGQTYSAPLHVTFQLREEKGTKEEKVYMGEIPLMTPQGHVRHQWCRARRGQPAPSLARHRVREQPAPQRQDTVFLPHHPGPRKFVAGSAVRHERPALYLSRPPQTPPEVPGDDVPARDWLVLQQGLRLGRGAGASCSTTLRNSSSATNSKTKLLATKVLIQDVRDGEITVARAFEPLTRSAVRQLLDLGITTVQAVDIKTDDTIIKAIKKDPAHDEDEALKDIYRRLRPGDPPTVANARALLKRLFFDPKKYDLGRVGRYKLNQKLSMETDLGKRVLEDDDFIAAMKYLIGLRNSEGTLDDIDHLGSRRVRTVGELLANQCRVGLARTERLVKERMTLFDVNVDGMTPQKLINPKALSAVIRDFFGRSQLSQFMDQTNPLAELTHKRRSVRPRARRSLARPRRVRGPRRASEPLRAYLPHRDAGRPEHRPDFVDEHVRAHQRVRLHRDALPQGGPTAG